MGGGERRLHCGLALCLQILGELDDQNRVLRRQADDGDQRHLEVHVVRVAAQGDAQQHAEHAERHHQHHRQRDRPAFIQRGEAQEYREDREAVENERLRAGDFFFARLAGPLKTEARRQLGRQLLYFGERSARAVAGRGVAVDAHGGVAVIAHRLHRAGHPLRRRERRQRHQFALVVGGVQTQQIFGLHARRRIRLHQHALHATLVREVVDIGRAERDGDGRVDGIEAHAERAGAVAVDDELQLRRIFQPVGAHLRQNLALRRHAQELIARGHQRVVPIAAAVLQAEGEARRGAEFGNRRRTERKDEGVADAHQRAERATGDGLHAVGGAGALRPILQRDKRQRRVLALTREAEAEHADHALHFGLLEHVAFDLFHHRERALLRGARRQLDVDQHDALVFGRQERRGQPDVEQARGHDDRQVEDQKAPGALEYARDPAFVTLGRAREAAVEPAEEAALRVMMTGLHRLEQRSAQCRRERQGHERRETDGRHHHHGELTVDVADRARKERERHEHRYQRHSDADDGARDLAHRLARRLQRRQAFLAHDALDVLDHHDGIVHHDADHQHHAEHGQHVDREPQREQHGEGAEQCDRHHDGRDDGVAKTLQEQVHHQEHQRHGLDQGHGHFRDGDFDEARTVVGNLVLHALREQLRQLVHALMHGRRGGERVARGRELHADAGGRIAVQARRGRIGLGAQFVARDIAQPDAGTVGVGAQHDVAELFGGGELALYYDRG